MCLLVFESIVTGPICERNFDLQYKTGLALITGAQQQENKKGKT